MKLSEIKEFYTNHDVKLGTCYNGDAHNIVCPINGLIAIAHVDRRCTKGVRYGVIRDFRLPTEEQIKKFKEACEYNAIWSKKYHESWQHLRKTTKWSRRKITDYLTSGILTNFFH